MGGGGACFVGFVGILTCAQSPPRTPRTPRLTAFQPRSSRSTRRSDARVAVSLVRHGAFAGPMSEAETATQGLAVTAPDDGRTRSVCSDLPGAASDASVPRGALGMIPARDGLARSVQVRLARHAREIGVDPNRVLTRYAVERFLHRLRRSPYAERCVLKGTILAAHDLLRRRPTLSHLVHLQRLATRARATTFLSAAPQPCNQPINIPSIGRTSELARCPRLSIRAFDSHKVSLALLIHVPRSCVKRRDSQAREYGKGAAVAPHGTRLALCVGS